MNKNICQLSLDLSDIPTHYKPKKNKIKRVCINTQPEIIQSSFFNLYIGGSK